MVRLALVSVISLAIIGVIGAPIPLRRRAADDPTPEGPQGPIGEPGPEPGPSASSTKPDSPWKQTHKYTGKDFLNPDKWSYFDKPDPTHGFVNYQNNAEAMKQGLATVDENGVAVLAVDDKTQLKEGEHRNSVRISSVEQFDGGLFIIDIAAMPYGCSVWPAWWSVGPDWPKGGEIDILEGVHDQTKNQYTLHTSEGCSLSKGAPATGRVLGTTCASGPNDNTGCAYQDSDDRTYGKGFNDAGGGVYAHIWDEDGIRIWHFPRDKIPKDIKDGQPKPDSWGEPKANYKSETCPMSHFSKHVLTINTTLCGDWAGATYKNAGCPGTCAERVADPKNFVNAKWKINSVVVYKLGA